MKRVKTIGNVRESHGLKKKIFCNYTYNLKNKNGITVIALIITIIVLLILAGVTIQTLTGDNGIITKVEKSKEKTEIASEKEKIQLAYIAISKLDLGYCTIGTELERELNKGNNNVTVTEFGTKYVIELKGNNRYYELDSAGNVNGPNVKIEDEFAGDITKGGKYMGNDIDTAYRVNCIEDLVELSIATNGGNSDLNILSNNYSGKYIILTRSLDFNSYFSYNDASTMKYKDLNQNGNEEQLYIELTNTEENCVGFTPIGNLVATFDGQKNEIQNIYIKRSGNAALFLNVFKVKNVGITGNIFSINGNRTAGICCSTSNKIENCWNKGNITGTGTANCVGGIFAGFGIEIENCYNSGLIVGSGYIGGIAGGHGNGTTTIKNCYNTGEVGKGNGASKAGGILGANGDIIQNCYNTGEIYISGNCYVAGICCEVNNIFNCYNTGIVKGNYCAGVAVEISGKIINCYNISDVLGSNSGGVVRKTSSCSIIYNCFNIGNINGNPWGIPSGIITDNSANIELFNCFSAGEYKTYYAGQIYSYGTYGLIAKNSSTVELSHCYYLKTSHINKAIAGMDDDATKVTSVDQVNEEFYMTYIEQLNSYVNEYNQKTTEEKTDTNGADLYIFRIDLETGYPSFDI